MGVGKGGIVFGPRWRSMMKSVGKAIGRVCSGALMMCIWRRCSRDRRSVLPRNEVRARRFPRMDWQIGKMPISGSLALSLSICLEYVINPLPHRLYITYGLPRPSCSSPLSIPRLRHLSRYLVPSVTHPHHFLLSGMLIIHYPHTLFHGNFPRLAWTCIISRPASRSVLQQTSNSRQPTKIDTHVPLVPPS
jgi:hypothetical protein